MPTFDASATQHNLAVTEGDDDTVAITYVPDSGSNDISGWTFWMTAKENSDDADTDAVFQKTVTTHTDPTNGETEIGIEPSDTDGLTGNYYYDMQLKDDVGDIVTFLYGKLTVMPEVTEAA